MTDEVKDPASVEKYLAQLAKKVADSAVLATWPRDVETFAVLWVDDDPINNQFESGILRNLGASVSFVRSTKDAISELAKGHFDVLISDIRRREDGDEKPEAGYDLLHQIRESGNTIPVIFYSTGNPNSKRMGTAYGFATTPSRLVNLVQRALGRKQICVECPKAYDM
ncbi:MAG TPA: response regulator [Candidatus Angelobacter sp.]|nr:response regulator [Candidatus Angelobacter sp.]